MKRLHYDILIILAIGLFLASHTGWAEPTGKVAGMVRDKATREPLIGVNVILQGTFLGSSTDLEGRYSIINVPPGI